MTTLFWYFIKMVQILGLVAVISGLYYGFRDHDMMYELKMLLYGSCLFYGSHWLNNKYLR